VSANGSHFAIFRNKIRRVLSRDPALPWGGHVLWIDDIPGGLEIVTRVAEGDTVDGSQGKTTRTWRVMIEEKTE
jgi:hypothetical protein